MAGMTMPHPDFDALFQENTAIAAPALSDGGVALQETQRRLERALVRHQQDDVTSTAAADRTRYWDHLRRHLDAAAFERVLQLASRHSLAWTNAFIESLVVYDANTRGFSVQPQRLKTLLFLQQHCGLQSRDLSSIQSPNSSPNALYSSSSVLYLFERGIEGDQFNTPLLDEVYRFLKTLEHSNAINWVMFLVKNGFLNFSMLHKTCFIEKNGQKQSIDEGPFLDWLTQWAQQCGVEQEMKADDAWNTRCQSNNSLTACQRTVRNLVRYGLSPPTDLGASLATRKTVLSYYQTQDSTFCESDQFVPSIVGDSVTSSKDNHDWLQSYTNPEDRYTLYRLRQVLPLDRLKFYHDYRRLPALIQQVQTGTLSLVEVKEYDALPTPEQKMERDANFDYHNNEVGPDYNYVTPGLMIKSRKLPRLLAQFTAADAFQDPSEIARYELFDYNPRHNPTRCTTLLPNRPNLQKIFAAHEAYLDEVFDKLIIPVATERARLFHDWYFLNEKVMSSPESEHSAGLFGCCYKTPRQEMRLIEEKIELLSGFLREQCINLKCLEIRVATNKAKGELPSEAKKIHPERMPHYKIQHSLQRIYHEVYRKKGNKHYLTGSLQLDPFYHQELRGMVSASDLDSNHTKNDNPVRLRVVTNEARDWAGSFLKAAIGTLLAIPALVVAAVNNVTFKVPSCSFNHFYGSFFTTKSHFALYKAEETAEQLVQKRDVTDIKFRDLATAEIAVH